MSQHTLDEERDCFPVAVTVFARASSQTARVSPPDLSSHETYVCSLAAAVAVGEAAARQGQYPPVRRQTQTKANSRATLLFYLTFPAVRGSASI